MVCVMGCTESFQWWIGCINKNGLMVDVVGEHAQVFRMCCMCMDGWMDGQSLAYKEV